MPRLLPAVTAEFPTTINDAHGFAYPNIGRSLSNDISENLLISAFPSVFDNKVFPDIFAPLTLPISYVIDTANDRTDFSDLAADDLSAEDRIKADFIVQWRAMMAVIMLAQFNNFPLYIESLPIEFPTPVGTAPTDARTVTLDPIRRFTPKQSVIIPELAIKSESDIHLLYTTYTNDTGNTVKQYLGIFSPYTLIAPLQDGMDYLANKKNPNTEWIRWIYIDAETALTSVADPSGAINAANSNNLRTIDLQDSAKLALCIEKYFKELQNNGKLVQTLSTSNLESLFSTYSNDLKKMRGVFDAFIEFYPSNGRATWSVLDITPTVAVNPESVNCYTIGQDKRGTDVYFADDCSNRPEIAQEAVQLANGRYEVIGRIREMGIDERREFCKQQSIALASDFFLDECCIYVLGQEDLCEKDWSLFKDNIYSVPVGRNEWLYLLIPYPVKKAAFTDVVPTIKKEDLSVDRTQAGAFVVNVHINVELTNARTSNAITVDITKTYTVNAPKSVDQFHDIAIWPGCVIPNVTYTIFASAPNSCRTKITTLANGGDPAADVMQEFKTSLNRRYIVSKDMPKYLYLCNTEDNSILGMFKVCPLSITIDTEKPIESYAEYGIDFGTSSTTIKFIDRQSSLSEEFNKDNRLNTAKFAVPGSISIPKYFLPDNIPTKFNTILLDSRTADTPIFNSTLFGDANIFFRKLLGDSYVPIDNATETLRTDIKWNNSEYAKEFLMEVIALVYIDCRIKGYKNIRLTFTYPLSLNTATQRMFNAKVRNAATDLSTEYDNFSLDNVEFTEKNGSVVVYNESAAAAAFALEDADCYRRGATSASTNLLTIDIGGGSSDVFAYVRRGIQAHTYAASVGVGARSIICETFRKNNLARANAEHKDRFLYKIWNSANVILPSGSKATPAMVDAAPINYMLDQREERFFYPEYEFLLERAVGQDRNQTDVTLGDKLESIGTMTDRQIPGCSLIRTSIALNLFYLAYYAGTVLKKFDSSVLDAIQSHNPLDVILAGNGSKVIKWIGDDSMINSLIVKGIELGAGFSNNSNRVEVINRRTRKFFKHEAASGANYLCSAAHADSFSPLAGRVADVGNTTANPNGFMFKPNCSADVIDATTDYTSYDYFFPEEIEFVGIDQFMALIAEFNSLAQDQLYTIDIQADATTREGRNVDRLKYILHRDNVLNRVREFLRVDLDKAKAVASRSGDIQVPANFDHDVVNQLKQGKENIPSAEADGYKEVMRSMRVRPLMQVMFESIIDVINNDFIRSC